MTVNLYNLIVQKHKKRIVKLQIKKKFLYLRGKKHMQKGKMHNKLCKSCIKNENIYNIGIKIVEVY